MRDSAIKSTVNIPQNANYSPGASQLAGNTMASRIIENQPMFGHKQGSPTEVYGSNMSNSEDKTFGSTVDSI